MKEGELFMPFAPNTRSRSWMVTIQVANMENAGLTKEEYENAELLANFMIETWEHSGKDRTAGISVCRSKEGLYHCHMACYGNTTTLKRVCICCRKEEYLVIKFSYRDSLLFEGG